MTGSRPKWVLVAGGSGGIGAAVCRALADDGWDVALTYRANASAAEQVAVDVEQRGRRASVARVDLTDEAAASRLVSEAGGDDPLSGVVYAAGPHIPMKYISAMPPKMLADLLAQDAVACFNLLQPSIEPLRETQGAIVAVSTPAVMRYAKRDLLSAAPKAAIEQVVRGIASEEGRNGVRANSVAVGLLEGAGMWTELRERGDYTEEMLAAAKRNIPLRRFGEVEDISEAVRFLLSPRAKWITGQVLAVDGGYSV